MAHLRHSGGPLAAKPVGDVNTSPRIKEPVCPAASITKPTREITRDRTPCLEELREIWRAANELGYPFGPIVKLLMLTAGRREEVGAIRVAELAIGESVVTPCWILPAARSKNRRAIRTPLCPLARSIIVEALAHRPLESDYLFTTTGIRPVSGWSKAKSRLDGVIAQRRRRADVVADMEPWCFHDFRRAFATHACDELHVDPAVADRCLNHVGSATASTVARIYGRNELFEQRRDALERWADLLTNEPQNTLEIGLFVS